VTDKPVMATMRTSQAAPGEPRKPDIFPSYSCLAPPIVRSAERDCS
jgi:hypothetical protein